MFLEAAGKEIRIDGRLVRIGRLEGDSYKFMSAPEAVIAALRTAEHRVDLFTFIQSVSDTARNYPYPMEWDNMAVLPISTFDHWWTQQIGFKARNKAKQAEKKGVALLEVPFDDTLVRGISEIYDETPIRQGRRFPHYRKSLEAVRREAATFLDSSVFIGAFLGNKLIGFAKLTIDDARTQAGLMHILSLVQHRDKAPTNAIVMKAVKSCAERGIPNLVYSGFMYGNKQKDSLTEFKERNAFQRVDVPRYYVPLTRIGHVALRLGFHRSRLVDHVPGRMIVLLRNTRRAYYAKRFSA